MSAVTAMPTRADRPTPSSGRDDPRLRAWCETVRTCAAGVLRDFQAAWTEPGLDDAGRAAAAVGSGPTVPVDRMPELPRTGLLAEVVDVTGIDAGAEAVLATAWWATVDPQLAVLLGCVHDDARRRYPSLGLLALVFGRIGLPIPLAITDTHPLVLRGLCDPVPDADAAVRLPATTSALLAGQRAAAPAIAAPAARVAVVTRHAAELIERGGRVIVRCRLSDDRALVRDAVCSELGLPAAPVDRTEPVAALLHELRFELPAAELSPGELPPPGCVLAVAGPGAAPGPDWHMLELAGPSLEDAEACWRRELREAGLRPHPDELSDLAGLVALSEAGIAAVTRQAATAASAADGRLTIGDVRAALRARPRHDLGGLARRLAAGARLDDLVLADVTRSGLADLLAHARHSAAVHARMGLTSSRGRAVIALFHGPSGSGKTAAAEAVAAELDRELWVVDLARVVSKWLGETQRNLDTVLNEAEAAGAVLLFDEADGLFGKRGEVTDARDRYANLEIDHLLQRVEAHTGVVILTSNRPAALDDAFARRIRLAVRFDLPVHAEREVIWRRLLPARMLADGASITAAAGEELSGAAIRSAAVAAGIAAAATGVLISDAHLAAAVARELEKSKRPPTAHGGAR